MNLTPTAPLSGRRAQAARNDERILESARAVFVEDPGAPISAVARHAGVGISALYGRYASKEELLRKLAGDGLQRFADELETALEDDRDPWTVFAHFMQAAVDADTSSLTLALTGTRTPTARRICSSATSAASRTPAPSATASWSTTCRCAFRWSRPCARATRDVNESSDTATSPCCWRA